MKKALNIGCGPVILSSNHMIEVENSDFADTESAKGWSIDKKRDFTQPMTDIEDNTISYIVAWHIYEHLPMHQNKDITTEWKRVLEPGGKIFLACPDLKKIAENIVRNEPPWNDWFIAMVNIYGPYNGFVGDLHRWGYNYEYLRQIMMDVGFIDYRELNPDLLADHIGRENANKLGFAPYNLQVVITK